TSPLVGPKGQAIHTTQYSASARRLALILFCALPVLPVVSYATWSHLYGPRLIVLVTEPHGSQPERLQLCRTIAMDLETRLGAMSDVEVRRLCDPSAAPESAAAARTLGRLHRAAVVIWGTYQAGDCFAAQLRVDSMNILHSARFSKDAAQVLIAPPSAVSSVQCTNTPELQNSSNRLTTELALFAAAVAEFDAGRFDSAASLFRQVVQPESGQVVGYEWETLRYAASMYLGLSYSLAGHMDQARAFLSEKAHSVDPGLKELSAADFNNVAAFTFATGDRIDLPL